MKRYFVLLVFVLVISCKKQEVNKPNSFVVTNAGNSCGVILIEFSKNDSTRISEISGRSGWLRYLAYNLDKNKFNQVGQEIIVTVRKPNNNELLVCTTMNPSYPEITITSAEPK